MTTPQDTSDHPGIAVADFDMPQDFLGVDDAELERALKAVSWNPRDIAQFLRRNAGRSCPPRGAGR